MPLLQRFWPVGAVALVIGGILFLTLRPYGGNVTALFHLDNDMAAVHPVPTNFIVLDVPGYDGMQYYEIARMVPEITDPQQWPALKATLPLSYAYQRILLPVLAFTLALGQTAALPWTFLAINIAALLMSVVVMLQWKPEAKLQALALSLSPAAMIALHFSLAEPLTIVLLTIFLTRYVQNREIRWVDVILLSLLVLSREVNVLFVGLMLLWTICTLPHRRSGAAGSSYGNDMLFLVIPIIVFLAWHGIIFRIFGDIPFLTSAGKRTLPFAAILAILSGAQGYNRLTLSSIALFVGFFLPTLLWILINILRRRRMNVLEFCSLAFLAVMSLMAADIWGSITSIGRVITPIYPLVLVYAARERSRPGQLISAVILLLGLGIGLALALTVHPFHLG